MTSVAPAHAALGVDVAPLPVLPQDLGTDAWVHTWLWALRLFTGTTALVFFSFCVSCRALSSLPWMRVWQLTPPRCLQNSIPTCLALPGLHLLSHTNLGHPCVTEGTLVWALTWGHLRAMGWKHSILPQKLHCCVFCLLIFPAVWLSWTCLFLVSKKEHWPQKEWVFQGMYLTNSLESTWWESS